MSSSTSGCPVINAQYQQLVGSKTWTAPGPNGGTQSFLFCYVSVNISSESYNSPFIDTQNAIQSVVLPNNTYWAFIYDSANPSGTGPAGYGDILQVITPTSGSISYTYRTVWGGFCEFSNTGNGTRAVATRSVNAGDGQVFTWKYAYGNPTGTSNNAYSVTITDPNNNNTVYNYLSLSAGSTSCTEVESSHQMYAGASILLKTVATSYISVPNNPQAALSNTDYWLMVTGILPQSYTTTIDNGQSTTTSLSYDPGFVDSQPVCTVSGTTPPTITCGSPNSGAGQAVSFGRRTDERTSDFGGAILRDVKTTYRWQSNSNYLAANFLDLPSSVTVFDGTGHQVSQTTYGNDENNGSPLGTLGNQTSTTRWLNGGTSPKSQIIFNSQGMPHQSIDPKGNGTTYTYDSTGAYLSQVQYPSTGTIQHIEKYSFDANTGLLLSDTDQNNNTTTYKYSDPLGRLTEVDFPDGGQTLVSYNDALPSPTKTTSLKLSTQGQLLTVTSVSDGFGRTVQTQLTTDPAGTDYVDTTRDGLGHIIKQSNPHRSTSAPTDGTTTYSYDALGRTTQVTRPDGSTVLTTYAGRARQVQDEGNGNGTQRVTRISQSDGLGRLASLCEVAPGPFIGANGASSSSLIGSSGTPLACGQDIAGTGFLTTYQYDSLDNLLQVNQAGVPARTYTYDTLSELLSFLNPESGTTSYTYDPDGNLLTKTDARTIKTTHQYDALNRIISKTFTDSTPSITNTYDVAADGLSVQYPIGRLVKSATSNTATVNSYDKMGRVATQWQCTPQNCGTGYFPLVYTHDLIGDLTSSTNGTGIGFTYNFDTAAQLLSLTSTLSDSNHPGTLLSNPVYNPDGEMTSALLGNQITETTVYNSRLLLTSFSAGSIYNFNVTSYAPNGNALSSNDSVNAAWAYSYDQFNRLTNANQNSGQAVYNYVYDRFGNRWQQNGPHSSLATFTGNNPGNPQNNNRMDGYSYDAAGNLLNDGATTYTYDAENRTTSVSNSANGTSTYVYDALGRRVRKTTAAKGTVDFLYDLNDDEITELSTIGSWNRVEIHAQGRHVATYTPTTTYFNYADSLGTERARTNLTGALSETCTSLSFGDWLNCSTTDTSPMHFTGEEHDTESGLDHFDHRKYGSTLGRWTSPDLLPGDQSDPQSLNRYAYARNNPVNLIDLLGLQDSFRTGICMDGDNNAVDCNYGASGLNNLPVNSSDLSAAAQLLPQATPSTADLQSGSLTDLSTLTPGASSGSDSSSPSTLGAIQTGLDLLGVVPVVGDFTNAASGAISLAQGHYGAAALSFASAIPLIGTAGEVFKIARLGEEGVQGFKTFRSFKKFYGAAEEGMQWHHIVEQGGGRIARFGPEAIHNVENLIQVPTEIHHQISGFYSSVREFSEGKVVRQWLKSQSFEQQREFGVQVMRRFGAIP